MAEAGVRDPQLDSVHVPEGFEYLWNLFWEVLRGCAAGYSGPAITWGEIRAYEDVTGTRIDGFEAAALVAMSGALRTS